MDTAAERRYVLAALALIVAVAGVLVAVDLVRQPSVPPRVELMRRCFEQEKGFLVLELPLGSTFSEADEGGLVTVIETNRTQIAIAGSEEEAARLARTAVAGPGVVERRADIVVAWERAPSPTQRQALLDCAY
jgi:hypothetical protein